MSRKLDLSNFEHKLEVRNITLDDIDQILDM